MKVPEKLSDRVVYGVFGSLALWSLMNLILDPFGYIWVLRLPGIPGVGKLHHITPFCLSMLFLWFWYKMRTVAFGTRFLLTMVFCWLGYFIYDNIWDIDYMLFWPLGFDPAYSFLRAVMTVMVPLFIILAVKRIGRNYELPNINFKKFLIVIAVNFSMILWLEASGFFPKMLQYKYGVGPDPHGWVWLIGKVVGMLSIIFAVNFNKERG